MATQMGLRILVCGVPNNANLGDEIISDCVERLLGRVCPECEIERFDILGARRRYPERKHSSGTWKRLLRLYLPPPIRRIVAVGSTILVKFPRIIGEAANIRRSNIILFGGGQLLLDNQGVFPLCLSLTILLSRKNTQFAFFACGASGQWSILSRSALRYAAKRRCFIFAGFRDIQSLTVARELLGSCIPTARVVPDPALLARETYQMSTTNSNRKRLGLGIAHPRELNMFLNNEPVRISLISARQFYKQLALQLADSICADVVLFCNGALEDWHFLELVAGDLRRERPSLNFEVVERPSSGRELVALLASMNVILAHRLHAHVVAFSLGVPSIAFLWDQKVASFFEMTGKESRVFLETLSSVPAIVQCAQELLESSPEHSVQPQLKAQIEHAAMELIEATTTASFRNQSVAGTAPSRR